MKAAVVNELGRPPIYAEFPEPVAHEGTQVASVVAAALKNLDRGLIAGTHYGSAGLQLPLVAGVDGVARLDDGRLVYTGAVAPYGMMADRALIDARRAVELPPGIDPVLAAAIPNPGLSAWFSLEYAARIQPGQHVLVLGATGVTGSVAVQLAKTRFGAGRVTVVGRNPDRLDWLRGVGADHAITAGTEDFTEQIAAEHRTNPFDAVLDYLWGPPAEAALAALGNTHLLAGYHATRYVQIGSMAGPTITLPAAILRSAGVELIGVGLGSIPAEAQARAGSEILPALFEMAADGTLTVDIARRALRDVETVWTSAEPSGRRLVFVP
jgi:NADPH:quinone reductase-like Zn-dependent oxidoreductase